MNNEIKAAIEKGELVLFLGAGASKKCKTSSGTELLDGRALAKELAKVANISYFDEDLEDVYGAVRGQLGARLDQILEGFFRYVQPSADYLTLAKFAWRRIYTLNIDDGLDRAFHKSAQNVSIRLSGDPIEDRDPFFQRLDLIKLNGSVDRLQNGIIFSASEYAKGTNQGLPWYEQCGSDFVRLPFLFIGTKIKEPILKYHIERYKSLNNRSLGQGFVITPTATEIEKRSLEQYRITHIAGTLTDFVSWLREEFSEPVTSVSLALASLPQYAAFRVASNQQEYARSFEGVCLVTKDIADGQEDTGAIREFYKGFKPTWNDIVNGIPAELDFLDKCFDFILRSELKNSLVSLVGPAGSGKSTLLMQLAYRSCQIKNTTVYYLDEPPFDIRKTLIAMESAAQIADRVIVAIDNVDLVADLLATTLEAGKLQKTTIICAERESTWVRKTKSKLGKFSIRDFSINEFSERDARNILHKLQQYGSWTVLGQMTEANRVSALIDKSGKQLLIALLEATYGRGFEKIIESDYRLLENENEKLLFLTVAVITERNFSAPLSLVDRALSAGGLLSNAGALSNTLAGIVVNNDGRLIARHRVYVRYLLEHIVNPELTARAIKWLLLAFSQYQAPIIKNVSKSEAAIYKGLINHRFLWDILKGRETLIVSLYKSLEKSFELDGLFWLQYGLALRDLHDDPEALDKLRTAFNAYQMPHTQHALGQQLLIMGARATDSTVALAYAEEARTLLEPLDEIMDSDDTYPIVTLAEGHTKLMRTLGDENAARAIAKSYLSALEYRRESQPNNSRLTECYGLIFKYAATGVWADN